MKYKLLVLAIFTFFAIQSQINLDGYAIKSVKINTKNAEFGTTFFGNNKVVFSASSGNFFRLFVGDIVDSDIIDKVVFSNNIVENTHHSNVAFTNDLKTVYFTVSKYGISRGGKIIKKESLAIFKANISENGNLNNIKPMPFNSEQYDVAHPTLNKENSKLYFTSNMPGTIGDNDIFAVDILGENEYSEPYNLGPNVNTKGKEMFPFISGDDVLYFSSDSRKGGLGGFDLYQVRLINGAVTKAVHLEKPFNSRWDDFSFVFNETANLGFLSSNRYGGVGKDDIYIIYKKEPKKEPKKSDCNQKIKGVVLLNASIKIIPLATVELLDASGEIIKKVKTGADGKFSFINLKCGETYYVNVSKKGYSEISKTIKLPNVSKDNKISLFLVKEKTMDKDDMSLRVGKIDFNYNEAKILKRYAYQLDIAIRILKENPNLEIEFESHTDSRAEDEFNMQLSEQRIEAIKEYMGFKGIQINRIKGTAYGETKPLNRCVNDVECTDEEYLVNRRTTFVIKEKKKKL